MAKGKSRWFPRSVSPVHHGIYECGVVITSMQRGLFSWHLEWDGNGFIVPCPMVVKKWRGVTKAEHCRLLAAGGGNSHD